jgi:Tol biopolymer transport system component
MPADACRDSQERVAELSTDAYDWRLTFSPDGTTAFWAVSDQWFPTSRKATIVTARLEGGVWSTPEAAPFANPEYTDMDPAFAPDGQMLVFASIRPVGDEPRRDLDLWYVTRTGAGWSEPVHLGDQVNSPRDELYPSVAADGTIYFGSDRDGQWDIYRTRPQADGTYGPAERLDAPINSDDVWEFNPEISPDGQTLVFTMLSHPDGLGAGDLYLARLTGDGFDTPINLGECVNSSSDEYHPTVVWDGEPVIYFVRNGDFHRVDLPQQG